MTIHFTAGLDPSHLGSPLVTFFLQYNNFCLKGLTYCGAFTSMCSLRSCLGEWRAVLCWDIALCSCWQWNAARLPIETEITLTSLGYNWNLRPILSGIRAIAYKQISNVHTWKPCWQTGHGLAPSNEIMECAKFAQEIAVKEKSSLSQIY